MRKLVSLLLVLCMILGMSVNVWAVDPVAMVDDTIYTNFSEALANWADGTTLTLLANVEVAETSENRSSRVDIDGKTVVLDLNGYTLSFENHRGRLCVGARDILNNISEGHLTIRDKVGTGKVDAKRYSINIDAGSVTLEGGTLQHGINVYSDGVFNMTGGKIETEYESRVAIDNYGIVNISGGHIDCHFGVKAHRGAVSNISGVVVIDEASDYNLYGCGTFRVTGGTFDHCNDEPEVFLKNHNKYLSSCYEFEQNTDGKYVLVHTNQDAGHQCEAVVVDCVDDDEDVYCDRCSALLPHTCVDEDDDKYYCDLCGDIMPHDCTDDDGDHYCNICGEVISTCTYGSDGKCTVCGEENPNDENQDGTDPKPTPSPVPTPDDTDDSWYYKEIEETETLVVRIKFDGVDEDEFDVIKVNLLKNGKKHDSEELSASKVSKKDWRYEWDNLDEDEDWSVELAEKIEGYEAYIVNLRGNYWTITLTAVEVPYTEKTNPETGASDFVGAAVALAVCSVMCSAVLLGKKR